VALNGKSTRPGVYKCRDCRKPFSVTVGTVFERSKIPLPSGCWRITCCRPARKASAAHQIHRTLGVTYKTAWFMMHRIREAMARRKDAGPLGGVVSRLRPTRLSWRSLPRLARRHRCTLSRIA
jgi:transposase-like protein